MTLQTAIEIQEKYSKFINAKSAIMNVFKSLRDEYEDLYTEMNPNNADIQEAFADVDGDPIQTAENRAALGRITDTRSKMLELNQALNTIDLDNVYTQETYNLITAAEALKNNE